MDVAEIRKLDSYLKKLLVRRASAWCRARSATTTPRCCSATSRSAASWSTTRTTSAPTISRSRSRCPAPASRPSSTTRRSAKLNVYLKKHLGQKFSVRKRPTKTDSADLHAGDEFVGVVFAEDSGFALEMAILEQDLEP